MIKLQIKFSPEIEAKRLLFTFPKLGWYKEQGYKIDLPERIQNLNTDKKFSEKEIIKFIKEDFSEKEYQIISEKIRAEWKRVSDLFEKNLRASNFNPLNTYNIYLTNYGVGGNYNLPSNIFINFRGKSIPYLAFVIVHEITHLLIENLIQKYKVPHWQKERIVDLTIGKIMPDLNRTQNIPADTTKIDEAFEEHFPDIEKIIMASN
jgi:hypothetical protein